MNPVGGVGVVVGGGGGGWMGNKLQAIALLH